MSLFRHLYLAYFSQPAAERVLYRLIRRRKIQRIVEIGVGTGVRSRRMILAAQGACRTLAVRYTGIDLFEARESSDAGGLPLKDVYRLLKPTGAQMQLVPGDPFTALARVANGLAGTELVVIAADQDPAVVKRAWFYLPRLLGPTTLVFREEMDAETGKPRLRSLSSAEMREFAGGVERRRAA